MRRMRRMRTPTDIRCLSFSSPSFASKTTRDIQKITGLTACANSLAKSFRAGLEPRIIWYQIQSEKLTNNTGDRVSTLNPLQLFATNLGLIFQVCIYFGYTYLYFKPLAGWLYILIMCSWKTSLAVAISLTFEQCKRPKGLLDNYQDEGWIRGCSISTSTATDPPSPQLQTLKCGSFLEWMTPTITYKQWVSWGLYTNVEFWSPLTVSESYLE